MQASATPQGCRQGKARRKVDYEQQSQQHIRAAEAATGIMAVNGKAGVVFGVFMCFNLYVPKLGRS